MESFNFGFSQKNIPLCDKTVYMEMMIEAIEILDEISLGGHFLN